MVTGRYGSGMDAGGQAIRWGQIRIETTTTKTTNNFNSGDDERNDRLCQFSSGRQEEEVEENQLRGVGGREARNVF